FAASAGEGAPAGLLIRALAAGRRGPDDRCRGLHERAEPLLAGPQRLLGQLALEHRRRLVGAHAQEQTVFFAGKGRLLRTRDTYPILSAAADGDDDDAYRPGPNGVR